MLLSHLCKRRQSSTDEVWPAARLVAELGTNPLSHTSSLLYQSSKLWPPCWFCAAWRHPGIWNVFMSTCKAETEGCTQNPTLWWGIVVGVCVALAAVLHQEAGVVPGHVEDAIWLVKEHVGQHSAVAVHDNNLSISSAKQYLKKPQQPSVPPNVSHGVLLQMRLVIN